LKKPTGSVRFWFYKPETEKTKPNPYRKKPIQTEKPSKTGFCLKKPKLIGLNRFFLKKPNRAKTGWFEPVSLKKNISI
jgi:hypothetical protein